LSPAIIDKSGMQQERGMRVLSEMPQTSFFGLAEPTTISVKRWNKPWFWFLLIKQKRILLLIKILKLVGMHRAEW